MTNNWPENSPDKLEDLCIQFCAEKIEAFCVRDPQTGETILQDGISLPKPICNKLFKALVQRQPKINPEILNIFSDSQSTQLSCLFFQQFGVDDDGLKIFRNHPIVELELRNCSLLSRDSLRTINRLGATLKMLRIEGMYLFDTFASDENSNAQQESVLACPNLRAFCIQDFNFDDYEDFPLEPFLRTLDHLTYLDLSNCGLNEDNLRSLSCLSSLSSLNLCNVVADCRSLEIISELKTLRHLDVSSYNEMYSPVIFSDPDTSLSHLVSSLSQLISLDVSGTNLPGFERPTTVVHRPLAKTAVSLDEEEPCGIAGLNGRKFKFLGLQDCENDPSLRENIPAEMVTGHGNEKQVLLSVQVYRERSVMLCSALNKLFHLFQDGNVEDQCTALEGLLDGMQHHKNDKHVQISASASLFYIAKGSQRDHLSQKQKRRVIDLVLDGMERFHDERTMMRNGCLTLCYFNSPQDVLHCFTRLSRVLLDMLGVDLQDDFIHRIGIYLLNCLACQVNKQQKAEVGELGAIHTMLKIIRRKLVDGECDDMMEVAWSSMWNITDETAKNCEKFIESNGMDLFLKCLQKFEDRGELLRNMMGLMGNIAEVKELRPKLMVSEYITVFSNLLDSTSDGIEVSYNAAGVLAHLASDGPDAWVIDQPNRDEVLTRLTSAIKRWDISSKRNINYRSFEPILQLLVHYDTPQVQLWATWALCNLTQVYPEKYCELLKNEKGIERLSAMFENVHSDLDIKQLAGEVIHKLKTYKPKEQTEDVDRDPT